MIRLINTSALLIFILIGFSYSAKPADKPLDLIHADRFISSGEDENNIINLVGNVHLGHGGTELWSDRAVWYKKTDLVVFIDSVRLVDSLRVLTCQNLTYYRKTGSATAVGDVVLIDKSEAVRLNANKVDYSRQGGKCIATGGPVFTLYPDNDSTRTTIVGDSIIYYSDRKTGEALNDVEIRRRDILATSARAEFFDAGETIKLTGEPKVVQAENVLEGDEIELHVPARTLTEMTVLGHAKATYRSRPDTLIDEYTEAILEGKQLDVFFTNDKLDMAIMSRNAVSNYTPAPTDTTADGKNVASGDSITLFFDKKQINRVLIRGGARGQYMEDKRQDDGTVLPETTFYEAKEIDYKVDDKVFLLTDQGKLTYQNMALKSGSIRYGIDDELLIAEGFKVETDTGQALEQTPVLSQDQDEMYGRRMTYNISTRKGKVELGETEYDKAFFYGQELRQVDKEVLFVKSGKYIPCEDKEGGVYFYSSQMKLIGKDKLIAKPVVLFIGPLPVFAIPYYVFPIRNGRHSGFLTFQLGDFRRGARFIRDIGYYWAASEYWDAKASMDYYENDKTIFNGSVNYNMRDKLKGYVLSSFSTRSSWTNYKENVFTDWRIGFSHNQEISETMRLSGSGQFFSSRSYLQNNSYDQQDRLNQSITSNMSFTKRWQSQSLTVAADQNWNLESDEKTRQLPVVNFSSGLLHLIPKPSPKKTERILPWEEESEPEADKWYNSITVQVNSKFVNSQRFAEKDTVFGWTKFKTLNSDMRFNAPQKLFGILTVNPSAYVQQTFYKIDEVHPADTSETQVVTDDYFRREVWSAALAISTVMYGTVNPNLLGITGFRHVFSPSISYSYAPQIDRNQEYFEFTHVGSSPNRKRYLTFSAGNTFQMKYGSGDNEKKIDLFTLGTSTNYDFEKDERRWGDISTNMQTGAFKIVNISFNMLHTFYDETTSEPQYFGPNLKSFSANTSFNRTFGFGGKGKVKQRSDGLSDEAMADGYETPAGLDDQSGSESPSVNVNLSHRYVQNRSAGEITTKSSKLSAAFDIIPTQGWRINIDFNYDLYEKETEFPAFKLTRDINCWGAQFEWWPSGVLSGYYFKIYLKKIPEIKVENSQGRQGGFSFR